MVDKRIITALSLLMAAHQIATPAYAAHKTQAPKPAAPVSLLSKKRREFLQSLVVDIPLNDREPVLGRYGTPEILIKLAMKEPHDTRPLEVAIGKLHQQLLAANRTADSSLTEQLLIGCIHRLALEYWNRGKTRSARYLFDKCLMLKNAELRGKSDELANVHFNYGVLLSELNLPLQAEVQFWFAMQNGLSSSGDALAAGATMLCGRKDWLQVSDLYVRAGQVYEKNDQLSECIASYLCAAGAACIGGNYELAVERLRKGAAVGQRDANNRFLPELYYQLALLEFYQSKFDQSLIDARKSIELAGVSQLERTERDFAAPRESESKSRLVTLFHRVDVAEDPTSEGVSADEPVPEDFFPPLPFSVRTEYPRRAHGATYNKVNEDTIGFGGACAADGPAESAAVHGDGPSEKQTRSAKRVPGRGRGIGSTAGMRDGGPEGSGDTASGATGKRRRSGPSEVSFDSAVTVPPLPDLAERSSAPAAPEGGGVVASNSHIPDQFFSTSDVGAGDQSTPGVAQVTSAEVLEWLFERKRLPRDYVLPVGVLMNKMPLVPVDQHGCIPAPRQTASAILPGVEKVLRLEAMCLQRLNNKEEAGSADASADWRLASRRWNYLPVDEARRTQMSNVSAQVQSIVETANQSSVKSDRSRATTCMLRMAGTTLQGCETVVTSGDVEFDNSCREAAVFACRSATSKPDPTISTLEWSLPLTFVCDAETRKTKVVGDDVRCDLFVQDAMKNLLARRSLLTQVRFSPVSPLVSKKSGESASKPNMCTIAGDGALSIASPVSAAGVEAGVAIAYLECLYPVPSGLSVPVTFAVNGTDAPTHIALPMQRALPPEADNDYLLSVVSFSKLIGEEQVAREFLAKVADFRKNDAVRLQAKQLLVAARDKLSLGANDEAESLCRKAAVLLPRDQTVNCFLDQVIRESGRNPDMAAVRREIATRLLKKGDTEEALFELITAVEINEDADTLLRLGDMHNIKKDTGAALDCYKKAVDLDATGTAGEKAGDLNLQCGHLEAAACAYDVAVQKRPDAARYIKLGSVQQRLHQYVVARQMYGRALQIEPYNDTALQGFLEASQQIVRGFPLEAGSHLALGDAYLLCGDLAGAEAEYLSSSRLSSDDTAAAAHLKTLRELSPIRLSGMARYRTAGFLFSHHQYELALKEYEKIIADEPDDLAAQFLAARAASAAKCPDAMFSHLTTFANGSKWSATVSNAVAQMLHEGSTLPEVSDASPKVSDASPKVSDASPKVSDASPKVSNASPKVSNASPKVSDASLKARQTAPGGGFNGGTVGSAFRLNLDPRFVSGLRAERKADYEQAVSLYRQCKKSEPANQIYGAQLEFATRLLVEKLRTMAEESFRSQHYSTAKTLFEKLLAIDPQNADVCSDLASTNMRLGNYNEARLQFSRCAQLDRVDPEPLYWLGRLDEHSGNVRSALNNYRTYVSTHEKGTFVPTAKVRIKALAAQPPALLPLPSGEALSQLNVILSAAESCTKRRRFKEALGHLEKAAAIVPSDPVLAAATGDAADSGCLWDKAIVWYNKSLAQDPKNDEIQERLDKVVMQKEADQLRQANSAMSDARKLLDIGRSRESIDLCHQALKLRPTDQSILLQVGQTLAGAKCYDESLSILRRAAQLKSLPDDTVAREQARLVQESINLVLARQHGDRLNDGFPAPFTHGFNAAPKGASLPMGVLSSLRQGLPLQTGDLPVVAPELLCTLAEFTPQFSPPAAEAQDPDVDFGPYMADLQRRIRKKWFPPRGKGENLVATFKIHADGSISDLSAAASSGSVIADRCGLLAVVNAAPFRPLPAGAPENVDIQFTFTKTVTGDPSPLPATARGAIWRAVFPVSEADLGCSAPVVRHEPEPREDLPPFPQCLDLGVSSASLAPQSDLDTEIRYLEPPVAKIPEAQDLNNRAILLGVNQKWPEAIKLHLRAIDADPEFSYYRVNLSAGYMLFAKQLAAQHRSAEAIEQLRLALLTDPRNAEAARRLRVLERASLPGAYREHVSHLRHDGNEFATEFDLSSAIVLMEQTLKASAEGRDNARLGELLLDAGFMREAFYQFKLAVSAPVFDDPAGWPDEDYIADYLRIPSGGAGYSHCHRRLADIYLQMALQARHSGNESLADRRFAYAATEYRRAVTYDRTNYAAASGMLQVALQAVSSNPNLENRMFLAGAYQLCRQFDEAQVQLNLCFALCNGTQSPELTEARMSLLYDILRGDTTIDAVREAVAEVERLEKISTRNAGLLYLKGRGMERLSRPEQALAAYRAAWELNPFVTSNLQTRITVLADQLEPQSVLPSK